MRGVIPSSEQIQALLRAARAVQGKFTLGQPDFAAASVGAALLTTTGAIHTGVCLDLACGIGSCAEHSAIAEMLKHRETQIAAIVAVSNTEILSPCGRCRELMLQIAASNRETHVILAGERLVALRELMPEHWLAR